MLSYKYHKTEIWHKLCFYVVSNKKAASRFTPYNKPEKENYHE